MNLLKTLAVGYTALAAINTAVFAVKGAMIINRSNRIHGTNDSATKEAVDMGKFGAKVSLLDPINATVHTVLFAAHCITNND